MTHDDILYYRQRAEVELARAQQDGPPEVVKAHFMLADAYLERIAAAESDQPTGHP